MIRKYKKAKSIAKKNFNLYQEWEGKLQEALESLNINGKVLVNNKLEYKALDIEERINSQIDLIRQECADMWAQNQEESRVDSRSP